MVKIAMDDKTKGYILKKGGIITILRKKVGNSWASVPMPEVRLGEPKNKDSYDEYELDGVVVYILKNMEPKGERIFVKLNSFLGLKSFDVSGFKVL